MVLDRLQKVLGFKLEEDEGLQPSLSVFINVASSLCLGFPASKIPFYVLKRRASSLLVGEQQYLTSVNRGRRACYLMTSQTDFT